jgi:protein O-GlcNAc transferase
MSMAESARLQGQGRLAEAEAECRRAMRAVPADPKSLHQLATIVHAQRRIDEAAEIMRRAVGLSPNSIPLRVNLGAMLGQLGKLEDALEQLRQAVRLGGDIPELHNNLGVTLEKLGREAEAAASYRMAIGLRFNYPEAHSNLGNALRKQGKISAAGVAYRQALELRQAYARPYDGLAACAVELGDAHQAIDCYRRMVELDPANPATRSSLLYTLHYSDKQGADSLHREHLEWGRLFCDPLRQHIQPHENDRDPDRRLRVGYVSPDLREQTVTKFISCAIEHHDRQNFEVFCYSDAEKPDAVTGRIKSWSEHWRHTRGQSDETMDRLIRSDGVDILVDLRGHAADNRLTLFARKPAPVQINMVGYFNTTGLSAMDYRLTDRHMDPPGKTEHLNTEKLIRLEPSCWCYSPEPDAPEVAESPAVKNGYMTFGSLNKVVKISEPCAELWAAVLDAVPSSRLLLSASGDAVPAARQRLAAMGLPVERLILVDKTRTSREYLERLNQIDIALDTFPFNGITTTCDGLWVGVPCVSLAGQTSVSRAGKSILHACGLGELTADTPEHFVRIAADLANDLTRLRDLRLGMRRRLLASALMDHRGFAAKLEAAYRGMWRSAAAASVAL